MTSHSILRLAGRTIVCVLLCLAAAGTVSAAITVTQSTWNVVGLDSNTPASGPNRFPVGAKVCSTTAVANVTVTLVWDSANPSVYLRPGSANPVTIPSIAAGGCVDAYFEAEIQQTSAAFDTSRRYHITAGGASSPTPRELYVERLVSQSRNYITNVRLNGASVPAGGSMNLVVGNTYTIELVGGTATQGYSQFEEFINFPNTIFQVLSVSTTYSANDSPYVSNPSDKLYADACLWENDPNSPYYLSCVGGDYKAGGNNVVTIYSVKIIGGGGSTQTLNTLLYDFSGSSFHYNADYSTGTRIANIIDPATVTISKSFSPNPTNVTGVSTLTFTITNPNAGLVGGIAFTDVFPTSPGAMTLYDTVIANSCGGSLTDSSGGALNAGDAGIRLTGGAAPANGSCTVQVNVTPPAVGTYANTSGSLSIGALDTGHTASASLTVNTTPPPPTPSSTCAAPATLATWTFDNLTAGTNTTAPSYSFKASNVSTASATITGSTTSTIDNTTYSSALNSWKSAGYTTSSTATDATQAYIDFVVDTSNYGGVGIAFAAYTVSGNWGGTNHLYLYSATTGGFTNLLTTASLPTAWTNYSYAAAATGSTTTTFRINAAGSKTNPAPSSLSIDTVSITGCTRPDPTKLTLAKAFSLNPIAVNGTSTLTFTITNLNATSTAPLTGVTFTDALPSGLEVAATPNASTTCGGGPTWTPAAGATTLTFGSPAGATLSPGASCTARVDIKATTAGPHDNVSGFISSTQSGSNTSSTGFAAATLTAVLPPSIAKLFAPNPILTNRISKLTFTITNPNQNNALNGVAFSDTFPVAPGAMVVANPPNASTSNCGAPTFSPVAGAASISFTNGTIAAGSICYVSVDVTVPAIGTYNNTSGAVSHVINAATVNGNTATASLTVNTARPAISLLKQAGPAATGPWNDFLAVTTGSNVYYRFTIENTGDAPLSPVSVSDPQVSTATCTWPASLPVAVPSNENHIATCVVGPVTAVAGTHTNTATASGTYSGTPYTDTATATYATISLTFAKSATQTYFTAAGNVLNYSYTLTNSGSAPLVGPVIVADNKSTDESCPAMSTVGDNDNYLDPSESITCTATYTVVAADVTAKQVTNTAAATVGGVTTAVASKTVPLAADLTATKTNNKGGNVLLGESFIWTITVANAASSGSPATFADTQTLLTDDLPVSGATYAVGAVTKAGVTGTISCSIASNVLTCKASGPVTVAAGLQGTVSVTNGSATVTGAGTSFTTQLAAGSVIVIGGTPYTVSSVDSDMQVTLTATYGGATTSGLAVPGSFSVPVTVTTTAAGSLVNPKSGGTCTADPGTLVPEIDEANNGCSDTVAVRDLPSLTIVKLVSTYSDPINGTTSPKAIPGSFMLYTIQVTNSGAGPVDDDTAVITDQVPANTELFVGDINGAGSGPVLFSDGAACSAGTLASGLSYGFNGLSDTADSIAFSKSNGSTWDASPADIPSADGNGCDPAVTHFRVTLNGPFNGASGGSNRSFCLQFRVRVK
jgi:uncharacterized repeat protein (TIGR01451 family)